MVFSVYHPAMAAAGKEANFQKGETEYRLGATLHATADYAEAIERARFVDVTVREFLGDEALARQVPAARKFVGFPMLLVYEATKP